MAAQRPVVLVFQEFATLSSSPATPELNCLIAGPAYWIQDFPEDRDNIKWGLANATDYGAAPVSAATGVSVVTSAVVRSDAPNNKIGAVLDAASVRVFTSKTQVELLFGNDMTALASTPNVSSAATNFTTAGVKLLDTIVLTDPANSSVGISRTIVGPTDASGNFNGTTNLVLNSEIPTGWVATATTRFRVERTVAESEIDASFYTFIPSTNSIQVNALATLPVGVAQKRIVSCELYVAYRSLRLDLSDVKTLGSVNEITGQLGRIDARNPLAVGVFVALQNTNTTVQYYGINADSLAGYTSMKNSIQGRKDIYAVTPLSSDILVLAMLKAEFQALADPDFALTNGVPQKFRVAVGSSAALPTTKIVIDKPSPADILAANAGGTQEWAAQVAPTTHHTLDIPGVDLIAANVQPGDKLTISLDAAVTSRNGDYIVAQVLSTTKLELDTELPGGAQAAANASVVIKVGTTIADRVPLTAILLLDSSMADAKLFLDLYDPNGTFVDAGIIPTDLLEMPQNPAQQSFTAMHTYVVASVVSNQRLRIVNNGRSTSLMANELPHGASRNSPVTAVPLTNTLTYRLTRTLDKAGQVNELISVTQSIASRRVVNVWPDLCDVGGLVDGSLPRDPAAPTVAQPAATQPGYYLACAVGGMTAGLPSHQGFTNLGIAGITKIYNSNTYFSDKNITDISNGGWFVFQQDTPAALPYVVHQLTTDVATLQSGEYSMVKNFDFVALFFADILDDYLGIWNVNEETMGFISSSVLAGVDNLKLRRRPRIGAPLIDGKLTSIYVSPTSADRIELYLEVTMPAPLNVIALHLVSV